MPILPVLLLLAAVILVNGWTDAPNAIAAPVASGVLSFPSAVLLAAVCNLLGVVCTTRISDAVARTLFSIADFGPYAVTALTAALAATVLWALMAGLIGSALALGLDRVRLEPLLRVALGLVLSLLLGAFLGRAILELLPTGKDPLYQKGQMLGAALTAFLHGAQDGQKFLGVLALLLTLQTGTFSLPPQAPWVCAALMALGTLLGGRRIIDTVGRKLVTLTPRSGFAAELGCAAVLTLCTLWGLPVSTTHAKSAAIFGAGAHPDSRVAGSLGAAWLFTFPACGALAFLLVRLLN